MRYRYRTQVEIENKKKYYTLILYSMRIQDYLYIIIQNTLCTTFNVSILMRLRFYSMSLFPFFFLISSLRSQFFQIKYSFFFSLVIIHHFRCVFCVLCAVQLFHSCSLWKFFSSLLYFYSVCFFITILIAAPKFSTVYRVGYIFKSVIFPFARSN